MNLDLLHKRILAKSSDLQTWFDSARSGLAFPIYSSFDLRDAGFKLAPIDANIFPAGFNNICLADRDNSQDVAKLYLESHYPNVKKVLLLSEEHTNNPYYWDNVLALKIILEGAGREVRIAMPRELPEPLNLISASGAEVRVHSAKRVGSGVDVDGFLPDLIVSNNDFSLAYEDWSRDLETPMNPPRELGWYRRRKDRFFKVYNDLATQFCNTLELDPWILTVESEMFGDFDIDDESSREKLAEQVALTLDRLRARYREQKVEREPFAFVKNNAGTYGLGVVKVDSPEEILSWNNKTRKKMKAAKGGREVNEVLIQEGIPTTTLADGQTAEPVMYMIGCQLAGGFLRAHGEKAQDESLNSPGAVFKRLCVADLQIRIAGCPMENAYGWIARLAFLSVAKEAQELEVKFRGYQGPGC